MEAMINSERRGVRNELLVVELLMGEYEGVLTPSHRHSRCWDNEQSDTFATFCSEMSEANRVCSKQQHVRSERRVFVEKEGSVASRLNVEHSTVASNMLLLVANWNRQLVRNG